MKTKGREQLLVQLGMKKNSWRIQLKLVSYTYFDTLYDVIPLLLCASEYINFFSTKLNKYLIPLIYFAQRLIYFASAHIILNSEIREQLLVQLGMKTISWRIFLTLILTFYDVISSLFCAWKYRKFFSRKWNKYWILELLLFWILRLENNYWYI